MGWFERPEFGANVGLIDEIYRQYLDNPESVSPAWRDFFAENEPGDDGAEAAEETAEGRVEAEGGQAQQEQDPHVRGQRAEHRGRHVGSEADEQRPALPQRVADRAGDELSARQAEHRRGDRQLRRPRRGRQISRHCGKTREVHVHRQRPERRQRAQEHDQLAVRRWARRPAHRGEASDTCFTDS